jgi:hypothetical protein
MDKLKDLLSEAALPSLLASGAVFFDNTRFADALDLKLTDEEIKHLEEPYKPTPIIGHT